ncbi:phosphatase PAP2 family protein [Nocardioides taihuensis]|uniref:Phosphatase PAP2 family protein n=1 Tax=Nocardioides taihuensis TaxID=1835606 RepID=A0ABW0BNL2_9ACTN
MLVERSAHARSRLRWVVIQAAIVAAGITVYFRVRHLTEGSEAAAVDHAHDLVAFERATGLYFEQPLQSFVAPSEDLVTLANWVYIWGHWPVILVTMAWLVWHHQHEFVRLRDAMLISGGIGMLVFALYPVAPPRLADLGLVDTVTQRSDAYRVLQPPAFTNQYAALPSLHIGWDLLIGIAIISAASTVLLRAVGVALPVLMALAVVATANHFVVDVVAGVALVLVSYAAAVLLEGHRERRRDQRRERPGTPAVGART